jgi:hypothetical protein
MRTVCFQVWEGGGAVDENDRWLLPLSAVITRLVALTSDLDLDLDLGSQSLETAARREASSPCRVCSPSPAPGAGGRQPWVG